MKKETKKSLSWKERLDHRCMKHVSGSLPLLSVKAVTALQELAPISKIETVAGRHRASPSASLDKRSVMKFVFVEMSSLL
ncbi:hypothetical protein ACUW84_001847 [Bacillus sp. 153480031-1]